MIELRGGYEMSIKQTEIRLRYIGKTGYHGLKHWKVYAVSIVSVYGKLWVEVGEESISYPSLAYLCRNWADPNGGKLA